MKWVKEMKEAQDVTIKDELRVKREDERGRNKGDRKSHGISLSFLSFDYLFTY